MMEVLHLTRGPFAFHFAVNFLNPNLHAISPPDHLSVLLLLFLWDVRPRIDTLYIRHEHWQQYYLFPLFHLTQSLLFSSQQAIRILFNIFNNDRENSHPMCKLYQSKSVSHTWLMSVTFLKQKLKHFVNNCLQQLTHFSRKYWSSIQLVRWFMLRPLEANPNAFVFSRNIVFHLLPDQALNLSVTQGYFLSMFHYVSTVPYLLPWFLSCHGNLLITRKSRYFYNTILTTSLKLPSTKFPYRFKTQTIICINIQVNETCQEKQQLVCNASHEFIESFQKNLISIFSLHHSIPRQHFLAHQMGKEDSQRNRIHDDRGFPGGLCFLEHKHSPPLIPWGTRGWWCFCNMESPEHPGGTSPHAQSSRSSGVHRFGDEHWTGKLRCVELCNNLWKKKSSGRPAAGAMVTRVIGDCWGNGVGSKGSVS